MRNVDLIPFKQIIQEIMVYNGWESNIEFADHYKIQPSQVTRWLNGQQPKNDTYIKYFNILSDLKKDTTVKKEKVV